MNQIIELHDLVWQVQQETADLANESSRIISAFHHVDPSGMREILKAAYHINWNLKDFDEVLGTLTKKSARKPSNLESIQYEDIDDITEAILGERVVAFHKRVQILLVGLKRISATFRGIGVDVPQLFDFLLSRTSLDFQFLTQDISKTIDKKLDSET